MEPGHRIEHYVLIEQIGQGGQAVVWSAEDERLSRTVAIKTILPKTELNDQMSTEEGGGDSTMSLPVERFRREAQIIADLEHPSVLPIYTFGEDGEQLYIVMRYMAGGSLKKILQHEPLTLERTINMARPLADALDMAHQHKIIHRDIKSANVLLDGRQHAYLADFGLSVTAGDATGEGGTGTLAYMSPEQMAGKSIDHRADLYAFGIVVYEMLAGNPPTINHQPWNIQQMLTGAELPVPEGVPEGAMDVLRRATAQNPEDRFANATEMIEALAGTLAPSREAETEPEARTFLPITDPAVLAMLKASDLFGAALEDWADGAGRFRFYAEDFQYVDSYYRSSDEWGLTLHEPGQRLMFRGALEHGYNLKLWAERLANPADQRAVALQTLTSELPPARLRAIELLSALPDAEPPAIPIRVANIIRRDPDAAVRRAGIRLLEQRATPAKTWRPMAYSPEIDETLAQLAVQDDDPAVRRAAAPVCARLYSEYAVNQIGAWAAEGNTHALDALIDARDQVPALPRGVPADIRRRVFVALSVRQFFERGLIGRYVAALIGFAVGWATIQFVQYVGGEILGLQAMGNALASGVLYGAAMAVGVVAAAEPAQRLRAWSRPGRIGLSWLLGTLLLGVGFGLIRRFYYFNEEATDVAWTLIPALLFAGGFAIASGLTRRAWIRSVTGAVGVLIGVYLSWQAYQSEWTQDPVIYFVLGVENRNLILSIWLAITMGVLTFLPEWLGRFTPGRTDRRSTH